MKGAEQYAALQGQDTKARLGLLKEASDLAQSKGLMVSVRKKLNNVLVLNLLVLV